MTKLRYMTAGESHGKMLTAIIDGFPAGLKIDIAGVNAELTRRQGGAGRGGRMRIESDEVCFTAGLRNSVTTGNPIAFYISNNDHAAWQNYMDCGSCDTTRRKVTAVRPGHADLSGCLKYNHKDARNVLERASARETAARAAVGAVCKQLLSALGIEVYSKVVSVGGIPFLPPDGGAEISAAVSAARVNGDTLGGKISVYARNVKAGFGSHTQYDKKAEYLLMGCIGSIQGVKSVSVGLGEGYGAVLGSAAHDGIYLDNSGAKPRFYRKTNNAGGIEGGMTNGEELVINLTMKPIPTLMKPLDTVDIETLKPAAAAAERSDVSAVEACAVVAEAALAYALAELILERTGGDYMEEIITRYRDLP